MSADDMPRTLESDASETLVKRLYGEWTREDQTELDARLAGDPRYAEAYRRVEASWGALDRHAEQPEIMAYREEALVLARRSNARRWRKPVRFAQTRWGRVAAAAGAITALAVIWQLSPHGYHPGQYRTDIGEQRMVELTDHSRIALDAATRIQVRYSGDARIVQLKEGQAQFTVAKDPARPFKVQVGNQTIIALGTVFTVEYVDQAVHVAMLEGRVAVVPPADTARSHLSAAPHATVSRQEEGGIIELSAGEELRVSRDGSATFTPKADLEAAMAWRSGKVVFRDEPLGEAIRRMNRYSSVKIEIAASALADEHISGVFQAGDTQGFVSAIERYLHMRADYSDSGRIRLKK